MKKTLKIILPLVLALTLIGSIMTQASYGVSIGETFTYDVEKSTWNITVDTDSSSGTGFNFLDVKRAVGTQFVVEVTAVDPFGVDWEMSIGTDIETGSNSPWDVLGIAFSLILPLLFSMGAPGDFNQTEADLGISVSSLFFVDAEGFSDVFYEFANTDMEVNITEEVPGINIDQIGGTFENTTSTAVFEWHLDASYTNATTDSDFSGTYVWQYAFDKTDGHMKGYYQKIDYSGTAGGIDFSYKVEQRVEEEGYNLPAVSASGLPGFEWFIIVPAIALIGGVTIINKKRKA